MGKCSRHSSNHHYHSSHHHYSSHHHNDYSSWDFIKENPLLALVILGPLSVGAIVFGIIFLMNSDGCSDCIWEAMGFILFGAIFLISTIIGNIRSYSNRNYKQEKDFENQNDDFIDFNNFNNF